MSSVVSSSYGKNSHESSELKIPIVSSLQRILHQFTWPVTSVANLTVLQLDSNQQTNFVHGRLLQLIGSQ